LSVFVISLFGLPASAQTVESRSSQVPKFKQSRGHSPASALMREGFLDSKLGLSLVDSWETEYVGSNGARVTIDWVQFRQDSEAYEFLSLVFAAARAKEPGLTIEPSYGTAGFAAEGVIAFFKGTQFLRLRNVRGGDAADLTECAKQLSEGIDKGEGDIPVLIKHLPNAEEAQKTAVYLNNFSDINLLGLDQPVFTAIEAGGNSDAVLATYGPSKLVIIEYHTPQLASENDRRITERIRELWRLGQPAPNAYRRVGNYSVLVFDSPDEQTAQRLIDQVKYEQVVQWLGENPNILKEAERRYYTTTLGVLVAVVKASGGALVTCLGLGALFGALLFNYRRAQQRRFTAFSDAGGMLRLNLDELTAETNPSRLLRERN
jgi:hypothetical protein